MSGSKIRLYGSTSGFVELEAPAVGDDGTLVLPTAAEGILKASGGIGSNAVVGTITAGFSTNSTTFVNVTNLEVTITPSRATSRVLVLLHTVGVGHINNNSEFFLRLTASAGATDIIFASGYAASAGQVTYPTSGSILHSPGTASAVTYRIQIRRAGTGDVQLIPPASLIAIEVAP